MTIIISFIVSFSIFCIFIFLSLIVISNKYNIKTILKNFEKIKHDPDEQN